jgi:chemotaxis protein methyltransferase CheR
MMTEIPPMPARVPDAEREAEELHQLTHNLFERYGVDFRSYAFSSLKRRVLRFAEMERIESMATLHARVLAEPELMDRLQAALTVHVTAMFRDPGFYRTFREDAIETLRTYPYLRFWVAGCSTGEEVYSLAILLHEEGLYSRCRIYATDISDRVLNQAKAGIFPLSAMQEYTQNYQQAGGHHSFAEYYVADNNYALFRPFLRENVIFAAHNLAGDASFNEFHAVFCRNVMIYFNRRLQERVHILFHQSLLTYGYLGLGRSETLRFSGSEKHYEVVSKKERLYRKIS